LWIAWQICGILLIPLFLSVANISGGVAGQIYPSTTGPSYIKGNSVSLALEFTAGCGIVAIYFLLKSRDKEKEKDVAQGVTDNGRDGDRALGFRYIL
jgi:hypothetical protein